MANRVRRPHFVVCGDNPLAYRLVKELTARSSERVVVILPSAHRNHGPQIAARPGVEIIEAEQLSNETLQAADLAQARAVALVAQDDVGNLHAALRAGELRPDIRLVVRMFNTSLGRKILTLVSDCTVLSDSEMAAPWFVAAALGELSPNHVRVSGRTLYIANRGDVDPTQVVCGIVDTHHSGLPRLLPPDEKNADLVLAFAGSSPRDLLAQHRRWPNLVARVLALRGLLNRTVLIAIAAMLSLLAVSTMLFAVAGHNSWWNALYLTLLDAAGAAQPDTGLTNINKIIQVLDTLVGIALVPVITATVVGGVVNAKLAGPLGPPRRPLRDHMVVVGLGNVGSRVLGQIHDLGIGVVGVDRNPNAPGIATARRLQIPVIIGDASREDTMRAASAGTSRTLLALTSDDVTNLQVALHARSLSPKLRVVLRLFDGEFAESVQRKFDLAISRSVSFLAAPAFAAAMFERQVIDTIAVGRQVLLIAGVPVSAGSALAGRPLGEVNELREAKVLALGDTQSSWLNWAPDLEHTLADRDRVLVVATHTGLGHLLSSSIPAAVPDPTPTP